MSVWFYGYWAAMLQSEVYKSTCMDTCENIWPWKQDYYRRRYLVHTSGIDTSTLILTQNYVTSYHNYVGIMKFSTWEG